MVQGIRLYDGMYFRVILETGTLFVLYFNKINGAKKCLIHEKNRRRLNACSIFFIMPLEYMRGETALV